MLKEANCSKRGCKHYTGAIQPDGTEQTETHACKAYPKGIPTEISIGTDKHLKVRNDQENDIFYEKNRKIKATVEAETKDGETEIYVMSEADDDWMRAGRLRMAAKDGDEVAKKQLEAMENTELSVVTNSKTI